MHRTEPPQLATWILEHGIPGDCDEALRGDLLEGFRSGRTDGWFWRQALAAWFIGWLRYLSMRRSLLIFATLWSTLAPAFTALLDNTVQNPRLFNPAWTSVNVLSMFWLWVALNTSFLWTGMLLFVLAQSRLASTHGWNNLKRAFRLAPLIFLPTYFATFVLMNLFAYPGFEIHAVTLKPLGEITDWALRADALRLPYFVAILWAMWGATPLMKSFSANLSDWAPATSQTQTPAAVATPRFLLDTYGAKRFLSLLVGAGLLNALIAGFLLCRLPASHTPSVQSLLSRAAIYVALGALAGMAGIYLYWKNPASPFRTAPPLPFPLFALACAAGWVWVPAMVLFSEQLSAATALAGAIGAFFLAAGLRHIAAFAFATASSNSIEPPEEFEIFTETLYRPPREVEGYVIALSLYCAAWAVATRSNYTACTLLALSAFLFGWKRTFTPTDATNPHREYKRAVMRLALVFLPAVLITTWALLDGVAHRNYVEAVKAARAKAAQDAADENAKQQTQPAANGISGYHSIILWPPLEKKQIVAPVLRPASLLTPSDAKPFIIRFDGPYWYFQPPGKAPSLSAHQARGTPLAIDIQTNNAIPLVMEAHQPLGASIRVARCRAIHIAVLNRDNRSGILNVALLLTDSSSTGHPQLYLGQEPVVSSQPEHFTLKTAPVREELQFAVPQPATLRKFDEITVMFLPESPNSGVGPKVAIEQFELLSR